MSDKKPNAYPSEFKESAVKLAIEAERPIAQTAKELGVNINTLYTWIGKYSHPKVALLRTTEHHFDEIKRLKKELARVTQERDLLKKAAAYWGLKSNGPKTYAKSYRFSLIRNSMGVSVPP